MNKLKKAIIIVPIICGIALFAVMKKNKPEPVRLENKERIRTVRVIDARKMKVVPRSVGYGYVEAERTWEAISEVSGKIVKMNENLKKGFFIKKGDLLLKIDTSTYGLAETRGKADVMNVDARLKELEQSRKNTRRLLSIEKRSLTISSQELKRKRELFEKGYISKSDLEQEEINFLAQQTAVNNLQNSLDLIPSQRKALIAEKKSGESTVTERQLDVAKTEIFAPFNCRLSAVNVELDQYAAVGTVLLEAESIDAAEIPVKITPSDFGKLIPKADRTPLDNRLDMETIQKAIGITAKVRLPLDNTRNIEWEGRFSRISESMDLKTGAITIYITVDNPYGGVISGKRPPLVTNMYVEVELRGRPLSDRFVIPRSAVHEGKIYISGGDNRLQIKDVTVDFYMDDTAVLSNGIEEGEAVILTDLVPAIEGMLLNPVKDSDTLSKLTVQAHGEAL